MGDQIQLTLTKKYAKAFSEAFSEQISWDLIENIKQFIDFLHKNKNLLLYGQLVKRTIFIDLLNKFNLPSIFERLITLLIEHNRLVLLADILDYIIKLQKEKNNIEDFVVVSSHKLTENQKDNIVNFLTRKTGKKINLIVKINKDLIAGLKIYSDTLGWEYSIQSQIKALSRI